ncbi:Ribosome-recycling factor, mitochondrial [Liparis tanakae]|uniref:Ribosome-recycling factor, mitochondrial n=1 Tax=Liparis tanakae TaxID=230148 RepID=A0A4Z2I2B4_9TELE|nr:Ribosome-recycling factor, mitochondrial [Liparis tanakae]
MRAHQLSSATGRRRVMAMNHLSLLRPLLCQTLLRQLRSPLVAASRVSEPLLYPNPIFYPAACTRLYATKKSKAKAKGQSAKVNINSALVEDIISLDEVKGDMTAVLNALKDDFTRNLSIRSSPGALDHIVVTTPDGKFPLNQLGQVSMKSPLLMMVNMSSFPEFSKEVGLRFEMQIDEIQSEPEWHPNLLTGHLKIQQMADSVVVDIDKQLAAKTKELLG